jgi:flagellar biosynthetic protein FlhB
MSEDKTEPATAKRRKKAREEGQVARSSDLVSSVVLLSLFSGAPALLPKMGEAVTTFFLKSFSLLTIKTGPEKLLELAGDLFRNVGQLTMVPMLTAMGLAVGINILQVGLTFTPTLLNAKASRVDLLQGTKRLFSPHAFMEIGKGLAKVALVGQAGWSYINQNAASFLRLVQNDPHEIGPTVGKMTHELGMKMVQTLLVIAVLDYAWQRYQHEKSMKMTKQEVKDEMKDAEGSPETRQRIRQRQREFSRRRMMSEVPKATVVITNPTHFAVALLYKPGQPGAPRVIAKGQDKIALRIREIAKENHVPVLENPPLARALFAQAEIGDEIPADLYRGVAEVLAMLWRLGQAQLGPRPTPTPAASAEREQL